MNTSTTISAGGDVISSRRVEGAAVYSGAGDKLGSIDDLMIDKRSGQVRYAVLEFGGFLGIGTDRYPLPWNTLTYEPSRGGYIVAEPIDKETLSQAPRYASEEAPDYTEAYGRQVHGYYGVPWYGN